MENLDVDRWETYGPLPIKSLFARFIAQIEFSSWHEVNTDWHFHFSAENPLSGFAPLNPFWEKRRLTHPDAGKESRVLVNITKQWV